jgi:diguanylate cyclase (GGDEF)-like protein
MNLLLSQWIDGWRRRSHDGLRRWAEQTRNALPEDQVRPLIFAAALIGAVLVGVVDVLTGSEIHVVSLYFIPLVIAGSRLEKTDAVVVALFSTLVWMAALYMDGARYSQGWVWGVNFLTQGWAFLMVTLLVSRLTAKLKQEQVLRKLDPLTGLKNRHGFHQHSQLALALCNRYMRPVALVYIDLDNFKRANDNFGHSSGDAVLAAMGEIVTASTRNSDVAGRLGGDEFAILLPETDRANALEFCDRLRRRVEANAQFQRTGVSASIGLVTDERADADIDCLLEQADARMYCVKRTTRSVQPSGVFQMV